MLEDFHVCLRQLIKFSATYYTNPTPYSFSAFIVFIATKPVQQSSQRRILLLCNRERVVHVYALMDSERKDVD